MKPPALAEWVLRTLVRPGMSADILGDLREEYLQFQLGELGPVKARIWYWKQAISVVLRYGRIRVPRRRSAALLSEESISVRVPWRIGLLADVKYSLRHLATCPALSMTAIATLALGIGVTSTVFSAVNGVLLEPLPYDRPRELVIVGSTIPGVGPGGLRASPAEYQEYLQQATTVSDLAAAWTIEANLTGGSLPVRVAAAATTHNLFTVLGVDPALGRNFQESDANGNIGYVTILSHDAWVRYFDRDPEIIGREIRVDDDPITVIGIMPEGFSHPGESKDSNVETWVPIDISEGAPFYVRGPREFTLFGRLADGISLHESQVEFEHFSESQVKAFPNFYPSDGSWTVSVVPLLDEMVGNARATLLILFASVGLVFLVVSTNIANLQLTRGSARAGELAVRAALGGSRGRIARQLFLESLILGAVGCASGVGVAILGIHLLRDLVSREFPRIGNVEMDATVLGFALGASLISVIVFGLLPSIRLSRAQPRQVIGHSSGRTNTGHLPIRDTLVGVQTALSLVLLIAAGLLLKSFAAMGNIELGFNSEGVLTMGTWLPLPNDRTEGDYVLNEQRIILFDRASKEMERLPGVSSVAVTSLLPLKGLDGHPVHVDSRPREGGEVIPTAEIRVVSDGYFQVMGIPLLEGRPFGPNDGLSTPPVVIVSKSFASRHLQGGDPLGERISLDHDRGSGMEVVGVVDDVLHQVGDPQSRETVYRSFRQGVSNEMTFVLRTLDRPENLAQSAGWALRRADPDLPDFSVAPMTAVVSGARRQHRTLAVLFGLFGLLTLSLSALGIFGVVSFAVTRRTGEIGVRLALGGTKAGVLRMLLGEGLRLGLLGAACGAVVAMGLSRFLSVLLYEVRPMDPWVFSGATAFALVMVVIASVVPAFDAFSVDPADTLKTD